MKQGSQKLLSLTLALAGALSATAVLERFSAPSSWAASIGWVIFFASLTLPSVLLTGRGKTSCSAWLTRLRDKG